jgi:hypothetical protein
MNTNRYLLSWGLCVLILGTLLWGCSEEPTAPPTEPPCGRICSVSFSITTWEDINQDGQFTEDEPPLPGIQVYLDYDHSFEGQIRNVSPPMVTDAVGSATLEFEAFCPCGGYTTEESISTFSLKVVASPMPGCNLTTPEKLSRGPYQFGLYCAAKPSFAPTLPTSIEPPN